MKRRLRIRRRSRYEERLRTSPWGASIASARCRRRRRRSFRCLIGNFKAASSVAHSMDDSLCCKMFQVPHHPLCLRLFHRPKSNWKSRLLTIGEDYGCGEFVAPSPKTSRAFCRSTKAICCPPTFEGRRTRINSIRYSCNARDHWGDGENGKSGGVDVRPMRD